MNKSFHKRAVIFSYLGGAFALTAFFLPLIDINDWALQSTNSFSAMNIISKGSRFNIPGALYLLLLIPVGGVLMIAAGAFMKHSYLAVSLIAMLIALLIVIVILGKITDNEFTHLGDLLGSGFYFFLIAIVINVVALTYKTKPEDLA